MDSVHAYKQLLSSAVFEKEAFQDVNHPVWKELVSLITGEVLSCAHEASAMYVKLFDGFPVQSRPLKTMSRILVKSQATRPDVPFKVNSDLSAVRIPTYNIHEIKTIMLELQKRITNAGGSFYIRNAIEDSEGKPADIVQYAFAFVPVIGYVVEIQVGHPFAIHTFTIDSIIRDKRLNGESLDGIVDLWDNDFYTFVKSVIISGTHTSIDDFIKQYPLGDKLQDDTVLVEILQNILDNNVST